MDFGSPGFISEMLLTITAPRQLGAHVLPLVSELCMTSASLITETRKVGLWMSLETVKKNRLGSSLTALAGANSEITTKEWLISHFR